MTGDTFTRDLFVWLGQTADDPRLTPAAFKLAWIIGQYINRQTGEAWPSQQTLAKRLCMTKRAIRTLTRALRETGHLETNDGRGTGLRYRPILQQRDDCSASAAPVEDGKFRIKNGERKEASSSAECESGTTDPNKRNDQSAKRGSRVPPNYLRDTAEERSEGKTLSPSLEYAHSSRHEALDDEFEGWYRQYPRKVGKEGARRAYRRVIAAGKASHEQLMAGALRYAAEREGQESKYTKYPETWLSKGSWDDEPAPPTRSGIHPSSCGREGLSPHGSSRRLSDNERTVLEILNWGGIQAPGDMR